MSAEIHVAAVRNGPHKMIRTGQCIGTYAGELLKPVDGNVRYALSSRLPRSF